MLPPFAVDDLKTGTTDRLKIKNWMIENPSFVYPDQTFAQAARLIEKLHASCLPVVSEGMKPVGLVTPSLLMRSLLHGKQDELILKSMTKENFSIISSHDSLMDLHALPFDYFLVADEDNQLIGLITQTEILHGISYYIQEFHLFEHSPEIINIILESAYEGVAVVDEQARVVAVNDAYTRFIGIDKSDAMGKHVTDVIENTNLHNTVQTGLPERGAIQYIQGQPMVVHRIPIWKNDRVAGAIGMLIFEGLTELYEIYERMQKNSERTPAPKRSVFPNTLEGRRITTLEQIIGDSKSTAESKSIARKVAKKNVTTLITGESGTGKEMYAQGIHHLSPFTNGRFVSVNCGAIPASLVEAELFGYEEGAFTDAKKGGKPGKCELAQNGTLFLDEIGEMPVDMQTKLLRVLQEKEFERVGGTKRYPLHTRIIAATNKNLSRLVKEGTFREDLYYRLHVIEIPIAPLRERKEDIPPLVSHYLTVLSKKHETAVKTLTPEAMNMFVQYPWPGNIRELTNVIERLVVLIENQTIDRKHLPDFLSNETSAFRDNAPSVQPLPSSVRDVKQEEERREKEMIAAALKQNNGNKSKTAKTLGIHRTTLYQKLRKYQID
ncbi:transcriptional regulator [Alteribacillus persepolensis]|uniref:Transcriptional regulator n=1 Tax=Alteribacillus persepolensis TaxID=568899 RepID=A0A1G8EV11_9BACI|nr:sigma 54-interacting transcriptional regulator [Alteribacillus persepolensis]SDH73539.1 transcriptional regulator [Alteribacillus persepolensis]